MGCFVRLGCFLPLVGQVRRRTVNAGELCARAVTETIHCFSVIIYVAPDSVVTVAPRRVCSVAPEFIVTVAHEFVATVALNFLAVKSFVCEYWLQLAWLVYSDSGPLCIMTDMHAGLLHFGFRASKERLSALVQSLRDLDFFVLEDLRSAETLSGTPFAGLINVLDEDLVFVDDVIHKLTDPKVSITNCFAQLALVSHLAFQVEDRVTRRRTGQREEVCQMAKVSGAVHAFVPRRDEARSAYLCPRACGIALV